MALTTEQKMAVQKGVAVPLIIDGTECILIRKDVYEGIRTLSYDDADWTEEEMEALATEMFDRLDRPEKIQ